MVVSEAFNDSHKVSASGTRRVDTKVWWIALQRIPWRVLTIDDAFHHLLVKEACGIDMVVKLHQCIAHSGQLCKYACILWAGGHRLPRASPFTFIFFKAVLIQDPALLL